MNSSIDKLYELAQTQGEYIQAMIALCQDWSLQIDELKNDLYEESDSPDDDMFDRLDVEGHPSM